LIFLLLSKKEIEEISYILGCNVFVIWVERGVYKIYPKFWLVYIIGGSLIVLLISWVGGVNQIKRKLGIIPPRVEL
jgi:hypothetical protein